MKCLVTGAAGFIGSHLCDRLLADGHEVCGIDNLSTGQIGNLPTHPKFTFYKKDILFMGSYGFIPPVDWVFHLAARADVVPSIEEPMAYHAANVSGTISVLEWARLNKAKRFIYAASSSCYGLATALTATSESGRIDPQYPYALTKWLGEKYVEHWSNVYKLPTISLRLFNVYGPRARTTGAYGAVMGTFLAQILNNRPVTIVGDGEQKRDFIYISDVVDAFIRAADSRHRGKFNIGSGRPVTVNYLAELLGAKEKVYVPKRPGEPDVTWAKTGNAKNLLRWRANVSIEEGVQKVLAEKERFRDAPVWDAEKIAEATKTWFEHLGER